MKPPADPIAHAPAAPAQEDAAWRGINGTWRPLHGNFFQGGLSVEWHDFHVERDMDWGRSFHPGSLEICLNFSGAARLQDGTTERALGPNQLAIYTTQGERMRAVRHAGSLHRFLTLELSRDFLHTQFSTMLERLKLPVRRFIEGGAKVPPRMKRLTGAFSRPSIVENCACKKSRDSSSVRKRCSEPAWRTARMRSPCVV